MSIDLSKLPAPNVVEPLNFETILATIKADVIALAPEVEAVLQLESEPITKLVEAFAYREMLLRARINDAAQSVMLAYAAASDLDHLVALLGVQRLDGESDDRLRTRAQLSLEGYSTAGPVRSYIYHALSASTQVLDVFVDSPAPGAVRVVVLAQPSAANPGGVPGAELLQTVLSGVSANDVRPLCDEVNVAPAAVLTYAVSASLVCLPGPDAQVVLGAASAACQAYVDQQFRLGYDVTVSGLYAALHQPGVMRVNLVSPATDVVVAPDQAARCTSVSVSFGGVNT